MLDARAQPALDGQAENKVNVERATTLDKGKCVPTPQLVAPSGGAFFKKFHVKHFWNNSNRAGSVLKVQSRAAWRTGIAGFAMRAFQMGERLPVRIANGSLGGLTGTVRAGAASQLTVTAYAGKPDKYPDFRACGIVSLPHV